MWCFLGLSVCLKKGELYAVWFEAQVFYILYIVYHLSLWTKVVHTWKRIWHHDVAWCSAPLNGWTIHHSICFFSAPPFSTTAYSTNKLWSQFRFQISQLVDILANWVTLTDLVRAITNHTNRAMISNHYSATRLVGLNASLMPTNQTMPNPVTTL